MCPVDSVTHHDSSLVCISLWFLSLCECSTHTRNYSTIGILFIVYSIQKCPVGIVSHCDSSHYRISHLVPFPLWMLSPSLIPPLASCLLIQFIGVLWLLCYPLWLHLFAFHIWFLSLCECSTYCLLFHLRHLVYCGFTSIMSCGYCVTHHDSFLVRISHLVPFPLWMLLLLSIVPPSSSCCLLWIQFINVPLVVLPSVTLCLFAYHIWFLTLCECSALTIACSTIGFSIVDSIQVSPWIFLPYVTSLKCISHLVLFPLWMLHHQHLFYCGSILGSLWVVLPYVTPLFFTCHIWFPTFCGWLLMLSAVPLSSCFMVHSCHHV